MRVSGSLHRRAVRQDPILTHRRCSPLYDSKVIGRVRALNIDLRKAEALSKVTGIDEGDEPLKLKPILPTRKVVRLTHSSLHFGCRCSVGPVCHRHHDHAQSFRRILELWVQHRRCTGQIGAPC